MNRHIKVSESTQDVIVKVGKQGEANAIVLLFDVSEYEELFPDGNAVIMVRKNDDTVYQADTIRNENLITWKLSEHDTDCSESLAQLEWYAGKTKKIYTFSLKFTKSYF